MTVEQHESVDFVSIDGEGNAVLTISDHLSWIDQQEHLWHLQEKLNAYLRFLESGEVYEKYPQASGRPILIDIVLKYPIPPESRWLFDKSKAAIDGAGFRLSARVGP